MVVDVRVPIDFRPEHLIKAGVPLYYIVSADGWLVAVFGEQLFYPFLQFTLLLSVRE
jgi:hypothetical protein